MMRATVAAVAMVAAVGMPTAGADPGSGEEETPSSSLCQNEEREEGDLPGFPHLEEFCDNVYDPGNGPIVPPGVVPGSPEDPANREIETMENNPPEVRQCLIDGHPQFGSSATAGSGQMAGRWLIGDGGNGGHWGDDAEVAGWSVGEFRVAE